MSLWTRLKDLGPRTRARKERDLEREIQSHLDLEAEESGHYGARRAFGNTVLVKEDVRAAWGWTRVEHLARDVGFGLRQVRRNPAFSGIAIATLALGIGANTAMFSAVDAVLIRPLPYADASRLVMVWDDDKARTGSRKFFSTPPEWQEWRQHNTVFTDIAASQPGDAALSNNGEPEDLPARKVTGNFWTVLGTQPFLGRVFTEDEDARGSRLMTTLFFGFRPELRSGCRRGVAHSPVGRGPRVFRPRAARLAYQSGCRPAARVGHETFRGLVRIPYVVYSLARPHEQTDHGRPRASRPHRLPEGVMGKGFLSLATATILNAVSNGYSFGFDIVDITGMPGGTVYPALRRLEEAGYLTSIWEKERVAQAELRPRRKYYELTPHGPRGAGRGDEALPAARTDAVANMREPKSSRA